MDDPYSSPLLTIFPVLLSPSAGMPVWTIAIICVLLVCSAAMSASEVAFFSLSQKNIDEIENEKFRRRIEQLLKQPKRLLATILIANNAVNLGIVILSGMLTSFIFQNVPWPSWVIFLVQVVAVTFIILLFGELIPKVYATHSSLKLARFMIGPITFLNGALGWLSIPLMSTSAFADKRLKKKESSLSAGELSAVIDMTQDATVTEEERKIWKGIVEFGTIDVKETMKPRIDVMAVEINSGFHKILEEITSAGYSRVPVYRDTFDKIEGVLYIKDLLPHLDKDDEFHWQQLLRPPFYVPENKKIDDLLKEFQSKKMHIAIVVDEYGGSSGIVTLEDVIEEIVGEINDEYDDEEIIYSRLDDQNYVFEGKTTLINLCRIIGIKYSDIEAYVGDQDTLAGLILQLNGQLPDRNQVLDCDHLRFTIESVDRKRIKRIKVTRLPHESTEVE